LVVEHLLLAQQLARRFAHRGEEVDDLNQVASLALVKASRRFDPERGIEFGAYATTTIIGELKRHLRDHVWAVKAPRHVKDLYLEIGTIVNDLTATLHRSPTISEIGAASGKSTADILTALDAGRNYRTDSLDTEVADSSRGGRSSSSEAAGRRFEESQDLWSNIDKLGEQERVVLQLRFSEDLSQSAIGERLGVSQMQVSRILKRALDELRDLYSQ
jgi:RNA polymerase sigma-B factor